MSTLTPREILAAARLMLSRAGSTTMGLWPRAASLLGRQALEESLDQLWRNEAPGMEGCSMRAQLLALPAYLGDEALAEDTSHTWWALTRATHQHAYELPPTMEELDRWLNEVARLQAVVEAAERADER